MFELFSPTTWIPSINAAETDDFWIVALILCVVGFGGLFMAFRNLHRARLIENTPTSKIRSAHQGFVEIVGECKRLGDAILSAPLSKYECVWYRYEIEKYVGGKNNKWRTVESGNSVIPFLVKDETGLCIIQPEGAEVTPGKKNTWYGRSRQPNEPPKGSTGLFGGTVTINYSGQYRYTEERIHENEPLYSLGHFSSTDVEKSPQIRQMISDMLRQLKADQQHLLRRFDKNNDGEIDMKEWDEAQQKAQQVATHKLIAMFGGREIHRLNKPNSRRQPFILSVTPQLTLVSKYRWWARLGFVAGVVGSPIALWVMLVRLGMVGG